MATSTKSRSNSRPRKAAVEKLTISRMTDAQQKKIGQQVVKMRAAGASWTEVCEKTGIPGGITGRKLLRLYGGSNQIRDSYDRVGKKGARPAAKAKSTRGRAAASTSRARGTVKKTRNKGKTTRGR